MVDLVDGVWQDGFTYTVTAITDGSVNSGVFYDSGITSVTFPLSLTSIGNSAFELCSGLTGELNLGECTNLTSIGESAFEYCSGLTSISLPSSLTSIGWYAFQYCDGLTGALNLGGCTSLTSIGSYAFRGCNGLTGELNLGGCTSLTSIGGRAFDGCDGLTGTVTIPASVTSIGDNPFVSCSNLEGIVVEEGNSEYYIAGNCLIENSTKTLITGFNNSTIPSDIKIIGDYAFCDCRGLTSITLPSSLISIGNYAFQNCSGLTGALNLGRCTSLTSIGSYAFGYCRALESVVFPEGSTGWYVTTSSTATSGDAVDVTNSSTNASNLTGQYRTYYWKRNA